MRVRSSGDDFRARVRIVVGQEASARPKAVVGERGRDFDFADADLEHVARFGLLDEDRAGEDVAAGAAVGDFFVDGAERVRNFAGWHAKCFESRGTAGGDGFHPDGVAGMNAQHGFGGG
jgi:hypothetical protein